MRSRVLMTGNEAIAEGAIRAGCDAYFGYPITPQNEMTAYMARHMPEKGRVFIQAESEIAAINMVFGTAAAGKRAMTSSSSPGISLKQEGISYLAGAELPAVIVNVQRGGTGTRQHRTSPGRLFPGRQGRRTRRLPPDRTGPDSVQEMHDLTVLAFELADRYRNPVMILTDGRLGQMMEPLCLHDGQPAHVPPETVGADRREGPETEPDPFSVPGGRRTGTAQPQAPEEIRPDPQEAKSASRNVRPTIAKSCSSPTGRARASPRAP